MAKKTYISIKDATQFIEDWKGGKSPIFKTGDLVERGSALGVIQFPTAKVGEYQVKWHIGPKPWNTLEGTASEKSLKKSDRPNPFKYKYSDMIPGPSSDAIDILNARMKANDEKNAKLKTAKDVEVYISALEEEIAYKKEMKKLTDKDELIDKIVAEEEEVEIETAAATVDSLVQKREKIISEE